MEFQGNVEFAAPREVVWKIIRDPATVAKAMPDFRDLVVTSPTSFTGSAKVGVSVIRGNFRFQFQIEEENPGSFLRLSARGRGIGSSVDIQTRVTLADGGSPAVTRMEWKAEAQVGGALAGISQRLLDQAADRTVRDIFANLSRLVREGTAAGP